MPESSEYLESGLLDNYSGVIVDSWLAIDANYNADALQLNLKLQVTDCEGDPPEGGTVTEKFSVGGGWASYDGGLTMEDPNRPDRVKPSGRSKFGELIKRAIDDFKLLPLLKERGGDKMFLRTAAIWNGLGFRFERVELDYGKLGKFEANMPVEYLGEFEVEAAGEAGAVATGEASSSAATESPSSATPTVPEAASTSSILSGLDEGLVEKLKAIRETSETHQQFTDKCLELPDVLTNGSLLKAIADENLIWKELG